MDGVPEVKQISLAPLADALFDARRIEAELSEHPLALEAAMRQDRWLTMLNAQRPQLEALFTDALRGVANVAFRAFPGRVHAQIELIGDYDLVDVVPGSPGVREVIDKLDSTFPNELRSIIFVAIRSKGGWGPLASIDYYAGR